MEFWQIVLALISLIIILGVLLIVSLIAFAIALDSTDVNGEKYEMDDETFERMKEAQYTQIFNLYGTNL